MRRLWIASLHATLLLAACGHAPASSATVPAETRVEEADQLYRLGLLRAREGDLDAARLAWRRGIEIDPRHAGLCARLGMLELQRGDVSTALPLLERAARLRPEAANLRNLAHALVSASYEARAAAAFAELFEVDAPTLRDALRMVDLGLAEPDPFGDALAWARRAVEIDATSVEAHLTLGRVLALRRAPRAEVDAAFERARELAPRDAVVATRWASALEQIGEHDAAIACLTDAIARLPDAPGLRARHVAMLASVGRCPEARMELDRLRALHPDEAAQLQPSIERCRSKLDPMHREPDPTKIRDEQISRVPRPPRDPA